MFTRRDLAKLAICSVLERPISALCQGIQQDLVTEKQKGDLDLPYEQVTFSPTEIRAIAQDRGKASFEAWEPKVPTSMIATARSFLGCSRDSTPNQVAEFLSLFGLPLRDGNGFVAFCAAGLSFCALQAYADAVRPGYSPATRIKQFKTIAPDLEHYYFYPSVSCVDMYHIAAGKRRWIDHKAEASVVPKPGWIVLYDWNRQGTPDHCGIVQYATKEKMFTVEFNTSSDTGNQRNGGTVAEKSRTYQFVLGFIVTDSRPG